MISQIYKCWRACVAAICTDFFILNLFSNSHNDFMEKVNKNIDFLIILLLGYFQNSNTHNLRGSATCLLHGATGLY
jgi:hypothetical protein